MGVRKRSIQQYLGGTGSRILIHGMNYAPEPIGVGKYTTELAQYLASCGHDAEVVTAQPHYPGWRLRWPRAWLYRRREAAGVRVTHCPLLAVGKGRGIWRLLAPLSFALAAAPVVAWRILRTRPDTVLCIEPTLFAAPAALLAASLVGAQRVLHVQDLEVDAAFATGHLKGAWGGRCARAVERVLLARFHRIVTISDAMADRLVAKGCDRRRVTVLRNWIDSARLRPQQPPNFFRRRLGIASSQRVLLYAGHLGAKQGIPALLDAIAMLPRDGSTVTVVAGAGPLEPAVRQAAAGNPHFHILPLQPAELLGDLLALADLHVLPQAASAADLVFPSKLGALLASGKPLVVTANPGTELARWLHGAAHVVPAGDASVLARAILDGFTRADPACTARASALAAELDHTRVLPRFAALLSGPHADVSAGSACDAREVLAAGGNP